MGPLFGRLCDDAAIFPHGNVPLEDAVPAHLRHIHGAYAAAVGPLVVAATDLERLARSFGTCSIVEPVEELVGLGLLDPHLTEDLA